MKKFDVTIRDILFFFLGVLTVIIVDLAIAWKDCNSNVDNNLNVSSSEVRK